MCYIPNIKALHLPVSKKRNFKFSVFVPMFELVTPGTRPVSTPERSTMRCYIPNIKALHLPVSGKNFKFSFFVLMFELVTPGTRPDLTPERSTKRFYIPNIKALRISVSKKKNFEVLLPYSFVRNCDPRGRG